MASFVSPSVSVVQNSIKQGESSSLNSAEDNCRQLKPWGFSSKDPSSLRRDFQLSQQKKSPLHAGPQSVHSPLFDRVTNVAAETHDDTKPAGVNNDKPSMTDDWKPSSADDWGTSADDDWRTSANDDWGLSTSYDWEASASNVNWEVEGSNTTKATEQKQISNEPMKGIEGGRRNRWAESSKSSWRSKRSFEKRTYIQLTPKFKTVYPPQEQIFGCPGLKSRDDNSRPVTRFSAQPLGPSTILAARERKTEHFNSAPRSPSSRFSATPTAVSAADRHFQHHPPPVTSRSSLSDSQLARKDSNPFVATTGATERLNSKIEQLDKHRAGLLRVGARSFKLLMKATGNDDFRCLDPQQDYSQMSSKDIILLAESNRRYLSFPLDKLECSPLHNDKIRGIKGWLELFSVNDRPPLLPHLRKILCSILQFFVMLFSLRWNVNP